MSRKQDILDRHAEVGALLEHAKALQKCVEALAPRDTAHPCNRGLSGLMELQDELRAEDHRLALELGKIELGIK